MLALILLQELLCMFKVVLCLPGIILIPITFPADQVLYCISELSMGLDSCHFVLLVVLNLKGGWLRWWLPMKGLQ